jgi:hypothetical protein
MDPKESLKLNNESEEGIIKSSIPLPVIDKRKKQVEILGKMWKVPNGAVKSTQEYMSKIKMTHGMFSSVPMLCQDLACPYIETCEIDPQYRQLGTRCPQEAAIIMSRFEMYCDHFAIDLSGDQIRAEDVVDAGLVRDLVDYEVQIFRTENRTAIRGDFLGQTINTVDTKGKAWYEDTVTPEAAFKQQLMDKKFKILQLLNSTRKDKAALLQKDNNPSVKAVSIFKKISDAMKSGQGAVYDVAEEAIIVEHNSAPDIKEGDE